MKGPAFFGGLSAIVMTLLTVVTSAPTPDTDYSIKLGKRTVNIPVECNSIDNGNFRTTLEYGLAESYEVLQGAMVVPPENFGRWFDDYFDIALYHMWLFISSGASDFDLGDEEFTPIRINCDARPAACSQITEPDGSPRLAVTDFENGVIYLCPEMFRSYEDRSNPAILVNSVVNRWNNQEQLSDAWCPDTDTNLPVERRQPLQNYQIFATTLIRELAHTASAIRRAGHGFRYDDPQLHNHIEKFGWMATHAYFMRRCQYKIPFANTQLRGALGEWEDLWNAPSFFDTK